MMCAIGTRASAQGGAGTNATAPQCVWTCQDLRIYGSSGWYCRYGFGGEGYDCFANENGCIVQQCYWLSIRSISGEELAQTLNCNRGALVMANAIDGGSLPNGGRSRQINLDAVEVLRWSSQEPAL